MSISINRQLYWLHFLTINVYFGTKTKVSCWHSLLFRTFRERHLLRNFSHIRINNLTFYSIQYYSPLISINVSFMLAHHRITPTTITITVIIIVFWLRFQVFVHVSFNALCVSKIFFVFLACTMQNQAR